MDEGSPFYSTAVHSVANINHNGSTLTDMPSGAPHDGSKIVNDGACTESVPGRHNEDDGTYVQPIERDCKGGKSNVEQVPDREDLVDTPSEDSSTLPFLRKLPITAPCPCPSLGDPLSSVTLARESLQYFKDRAQSACEAYLPSLRPVTTAAPEVTTGKEHIENRANDSSSPLTSRSAHSNRMKASEIDDGSSSSCFSGDTRPPANADPGSVVNASGHEIPNTEAHPTISVETASAVPSSVSAEGRASALSAPPVEVSLVLSPALSGLSVPAIAVTGPADDITTVLPAEVDVLSTCQAGRSGPAEAHPSVIVEPTVSGSLEVIVSSPASMKLLEARGDLAPDPVKAFSVSDAIIGMPDNAFEYTLAASSQSPRDEPAASAESISPMNFVSTPSSGRDSHPLPSAACSGVFHSCEDPLSVCAYPYLSQTSRCPESPSAIPAFAGSTVDMITPASRSWDKPLLAPDESTPPSGNAVHLDTEYSAMTLSSVKDTTPDADANGTNEELSFDRGHGAVTSGTSIREDSLPPPLGETEKILVQEDSKTVDVTHIQSAALLSVSSATPFDLAEDMTIPPADVGATEADLHSTTASSVIDVQEFLISENDSSTGVAEESRERQGVVPGTEHLAGPSDSAADDRTSYDMVSMRVDNMTQLPVELAMDVSADEPDFADDDLGPTSSPLPPSSPLDLSSPMRSSSPSFVFSSPPQKALGSSPPSSPLQIVEQRKKVSFCLDEGHRTRIENASTTVQKRALEDVDGSDGVESGGLFGPDSRVPRAEDAKRMKLCLEESSTSITPLPQPKRPTFASQFRERKKLAAPFRSPLVDKNAVRHGVDAVYATGKMKKYVTTKRGAEVQIDSSSASRKNALARTDDTSMEPKTAKDYPRSVAKQFKSPFHLGSSSSSTQPAFSTVQAIPTIRALQAEIQTLKQAGRIKNASDGNDDDDLEALANKWTTVGREVAWAVWDTVKDLDPGETVTMVRGSNSWFGDDGGSRDSERNRAWGFDDRWGQPTKGANEDEGQADTTDNDEESRVSHTLGTMLRHLGIAPETLGWDEEEGDFVDVD